MLRPFLFALLAVCLVPPAAAQSFYLNESYALSPSTGDQPYAGVVQGVDGNFYGVGYYGGDTTKNGGYGYGAVFQVAPQGAITNLHNFTATYGTPYGPLISGPDGRLYGTAQSFGVTSPLGCVFAITRSGDFEVLHAFAGGTDGADPYGTLTLGADGLLYGTTLQGGAGSNGTIYRVSPGGGDYQVMYSFAGTGGDGGGTEAGLVQADDGNFYGVTDGGGADGDGAVFQMTPSGAVTAVHNFAGYTAEGANPLGTLVEGADGELYGTTDVGGANGLGTIFKVSLGGTYTLLYSEVQTQGRQPYTGLLLGSDGYFYLTTNQGGEYGEGSVERMDTLGNVTTLVNFTPSIGAVPQSALIQAPDGTYWGTTAGGGSPGPGTIFRIASSPAESGLITISAPSSATVGSAFTLSWSVAGAYSTTARQCYALQTGGTGGGTWSGKQAGTYNSTTMLYTGSAKITPTMSGQHTYVLTCGGTAQAFATVTAGAGNGSDATTLAASANPVTVGQNVTLTATVTHSGSAKPTGIVTFSVNGAAVDSVALGANGKAALTAGTATLGAGTYPVVATYSGDGNYTGSASSTLNLTLNKAATTVTLTASPNPVTPPAKCTLKATVSRAAGEAGFATGPVTFSVGATVIGTAGLNAGGVATLSAATAGIAAGSYPVTAKYNGDPGDVASTSTPVTVMVQ